MTGGAKRGKTPAYKAARKLVKATEFVAQALAWARAEKGKAGVVATAGAGGKGGKA